MEAEALAALAAAKASESPVKKAVAAFEAAQAVAAFKAIPAPAVKVLAPPATAASDALFDFDDLPSGSEAANSQELVSKVARMSTPEFQEARNKARTPSDDDPLLMQAQAQQGEARVVEAQQGEARVVEVVPGRTPAPVLACVALAKSRAAEAYGFALERVQVTKVTVMGGIDRAQIKVFGYVATSDPKVQITAVSAAGGAVTVGATSGAVGLATGGAVGAALGVIPAIFTFGLSIPVGAAIGSGAGLFIATPVGGTVGFVCGGATGYGAYSRRSEICTGADNLKLKVLPMYESVKGRAGCAQSAVLSNVILLKTRAIETYESGRARASSSASSAKVTACDTVSNPKVQVTAASAAGGAVAVGATGGAIGFTTGGVVGAALGVVPAIFTFGLSIPIGAAIGSGAGLCIGTGTGSAVGLVGGGATGYGAYSRRAEICTGATYVKDKVQTSANYVKAKLNRGTASPTM